MTEFACSLSLPPGPPRKRLTKKTPEQVAALEAAFASNPNPSSEECHELSEAWGLTLAQVEQWFGHRRAKERKRAREEESGASGREGAGRGVASLADASRAFSAQPEWAAAAGQGRLPEVAVDPGGFDPVPGEETDGEGAGGTGAGAAGSGKRGTKRRASGAGPETAQDKKRRLEEGRLGKEMERLVARAEEIRARMASREEFRARGGQGKEEERAAGPGAGGGEAMAVDATAEGEAAGQVKGESGEGERGEAGDGGAAEPKGEGEDLAEEDAKDAEVRDLSAPCPRIHASLCACWASGVCMTALTTPFPSDMAGSCGRGGAAGPDPGAPGAAGGAAGGGRGAESEGGGGEGQGGAWRRAPCNVQPGAVLARRWTKCWLAVDGRRRSARRSRSGCSVAWRRSRRGCGRRRRRSGPRWSGRRASGGRGGGQPSEWWSRGVPRHLRVDLAPSVAPCGFAHGSNPAPRAPREMDKAAKDTLRRMDHKRARLAAEGALSEDQHIEWERVMMPHVERVAEAHGVGAAELR